MHDGLPDLPLDDKSFLSLGICYFLLEVAALGVLHDYAEQVQLFVVDGFLVADDVGGLQGGEYADLVDCVVPFFLLERVHAHLNDP